MEDLNMQDESAMSEKELAPSSDEAGRQPINSDLPDWYIELVYQAMERTGEDLSFYLYGTTEKTYEARKSSVERHIATKNSNAEEKPTERPSNSGAPSIQDIILKHAEKIPDEALSEFPPDFTENLDYYLYGMPKKTP